MAFVISKTFLCQDDTPALTSTPGALGGRSGMGLSGSTTSASSTGIVLSSLSVSTIAEDANIKKKVVRKMLFSSVQL